MISICRSVVACMNRLDPTTLECADWIIEFGTNCTWKKFKWYCPEYFLIRFDFCQIKNKIWNTYLKLHHSCISFYYCGFWPKNAKRLGTALYHFCTLHDGYRWRHLRKSTKQVWNANVPNVLSIPFLDISLPFNHKGQTRSKQNWPEPKQKSDSLIRTHVNFSSTGFGQKEIE